MNIKNRKGSRFDPWGRNDLVTVFINARKMLWEAYTEIQSYLNISSENIKNIYKSLLVYNIFHVSDISIALIITWLQVIPQRVCIHKEKHVSIHRFHSQFPATKTLYCQWIVYETEMRIWLLVRRWKAKTCISKNVTFLTV